MIPNLESYKEIIGKKEVERIRRKAEPLRGKSIVNINATLSGGGVAEILNNLVYLFNDLGIRVGWRVMHGSHSFFNITKNLHNALQGQKWKFTNSRKALYIEYCKRNSIINHIDKHDFVVIHDPQPLAMVRYYRRNCPWFWRCHIDISSPNKKIIDFFTPSISQYDGVIVSSEKFKLRGFSKPQYIISPSIDPLSVKNNKVPRSRARKLLKEKGIDIGKPIVSQVSRFDVWKDPFGVIDMFRIIREKIDCQLVLMGDMANDDPEGPLMYHKVKTMSEKIPDIVMITEKNDLLVNALQQESAFVFQNSKKEGFALTVSEALWKKTPVLATPVGGIPMQVLDGKTGYLVRTKEDGISHGLEILQNKKLRDRLGQQGHEHVKSKFLITRHLEDYLDLFLKYVK